MYIYMHMYIYTYILQSLNKNKTKTRNIKQTHKRLPLRAGCHSFFDAPSLYYLYLLCNEIPGK